MIYLSKGVVCEGSTEQLLDVTRGAQVFHLTGTEAALWLNGRFGFAKAKTNKERSSLEHLHQMGLAEFENEDSDVARYRIIARCILCAADTKGLRIPLNGKRQTVMIWLQKAGLHLSAAELIYLMETKIEPTTDLLYTDNRQALVELIYMNNPIQDNLLETQMEKASCRDEIVKVLLSLLKRKLIIIL